MIPRSKMPSAIVSYDAASRESTEATPYGDWRILALGRFRRLLGRRLFHAGLGHMMLAMALHAGVSLALGRGRGNLRRDRRRRLGGRRLGGHRLGAGGRRGREH